jgi:hypothetical protein
VCFPGAGESGKSTVLKQMRLIYSQGFSKSEKEEWRAIIFNNILTAFRVILDAMEELEIPFADQFNSVRLFSVLLRHFLASGAVGAGFACGVGGVGVGACVLVFWANENVYYSNLSHLSSSTMIWDRKTRYRWNT